jgi:hypothetical protein
LPIQIAHEWVFHSRHAISISVYWLTCWKMWNFHVFLCTMPLPIMSFRIR